MEFVLVVPRASLFPSHAPHGLAVFGDESGWSQTAFQVCVRDEGFFVERPYAERTPALKQVIPYTLVVRGQDILLLRRTQGGGEARLHNKLTIGVGGHINPIDATGTDSSERPNDPVLAATRREVMEEELVVSGDSSLVPVGLINDDSNPVGAVHVGFVQLLCLDEAGDAQVREVDQLEGEFVSASDLVKRLESGANFETWSSLIVPHLDRLLTSRQTPAPHMTPVKVGT